MVTALLWGCGEQLFLKLEPFLRMELISINSMTCFMSSLCSSVSYLWNMMTAPLFLLAYESSAWYVAYGDTSVWCCPQHQHLYKRGSQSTGNQSWFPKVTSVHVEELTYKAGLTPRLYQDKTSKQITPSLFLEICHGDHILCVLAWAVMDMGRHHPFYERSFPCISVRFSLEEWVFHYAPS